MAKGRKHIYLDCYRDGQRTYEFLKLYLLPGNDATTRAMNDNAMAAARTNPIGAHRGNPKQWHAAKSTLKGQDTP